MMPEFFGKSTIESGGQVMEKYEHHGLYSVTRQSIFIEIIFSRILSVPKRRTPVGILVVPNKRS